MKNFNPKTMITAYQLREMGLPIPDKIPDCAWTLRSEMKSVCKDVGSDEESGVLKMSISMEFGAFNWVSINVALKPIKLKTASERFVIGRGKMLLVDESEYDRPFDVGDIVLFRDVAYEVRGIECMKSGITGKRNPLEGHRYVALSVAQIEVGNI